MTFTFLGIKCSVEIGLAKNKFLSNHTFSILKKYLKKECGSDFPKDFHEKIVLIKRHRELTGSDLKEAKDSIETIFRGC